jgi:N-acetylneuraminic acid mutarotase
MPAGVKSIEVAVDPVDDAAAESAETVVLTLTASPAYEIGAASAATVTIADNDTPTTGFTAKVNFQPPGAAVPAGYLADAGAVFGDRGNGLSYGWDVLNTAYARDRNAANSPDQRYDTFNSMQRSGAGSVWEIAVPNGSYSVHVVAGDPSAYDSTYAINVEGVLVVSGHPTGTVKWFEGTRTVTVSDGRLTLTNAAGSANNKVCFVDITAEGGGPVLPVVTVSASDAAASESPGNAGAFMVTRAGPTDAALVVNLTLGGSANNGSDYALVGTTVTIPAGAASATVTVQPVDDSAVEASETVTLTVAPGSGYTVGSTSSAGVTIADNDAAPGTTLSWREVAPTTVGRSEGMGAVVNGKLYLFGGYVDTTFKPTNRGDVYDPATNPWRQVASLPFGVSHMGTVAVGDSIYFAGGYPATGTNQTFSTTAVWRYDTVADSFSNLPALPSARGGGALVALGRVLHFFGGSDAARKDAAQHWALDLNNLAAGWVVRAPLPLATNHVAGAVVDGKIYCIGGQQNQDSAAVQRAEVQMYDPATDRWTARAPLPLARSHITSSTFVRNGQILVLGGLGPGNRVINRVDSYNPVTNTWTQLTSLPSNRMSGVSDLLPDGRIVFTTGNMVKNTWVGTFT